MSFIHYVYHYEHLSKIVFFQVQIPPLPPIALRMDANTFIGLVDKLKNDEEVVKFIEIVRERKDIEGPLKDADAPGSGFEDNWDGKMGEEGDNAADLGTGGI